MAVRRRNPQKGGTPEKVIPPLGWLFLLCGMALYVMAFQLPWFGQFCLVIANLSLLLSFGCLLYWLFINRNEVMTLKNSLHLPESSIRLDIVQTQMMRDFLFQAKAVAPDPYDPRYQQLPEIMQTQDGLKIEAIGNLRQWLLSDNFRDDLESFLNQNGYDVSIKNAQYHLDGWVYFTLIRGIKSDRLRFK